MDNPDSEEDKYSCIRQTIRQVVLPLVQGIYDENPSDILSFCYGYFDNLLQKREITEKNDCDLESARDVSQGNEKDVKTKNNDEKSKIVECSSSSAQGSASAPHLVSDKQSKVSNLRETSSWDLSSTTQSARARTVLDCNLADAVCGIGDQSRLEMNEMGFEYDAKEGDANIRLKENGMCKDYNPKSDLIADEVQKPSAPLCEDTEENFIEASTEFEEEKFSDASDILKTDVSICNDSDQYNGALDQCESEKNETRARSKQLSPNSSFGFIPHLNEYNSPEERKISDECSDNLKKKMNLEKLTKKISDTFQNLAQEFSSAETNFNAEFQNAKEISDVIQGGSLREANSHIEGKEILNTYNGSIIKRNDFSLNKPDLGHIKDENNNLTEKEKNNASNFNKTVDNTKCEHSFNGETPEVVHNNTRDFSKTESSQFDESGSQQDECLGREEHESTFLQDDKKDNSNKSDSFESNTNVDESWRQRWYEAHPRLDNLNSKNLRTEPRMNRSHRGFVANCRRPNIGEAGDVLPDAFYIQGDIRNVDNSRQSSNESTSLSSSVTRKCNNTHVFSSDETDHKANRETISGSFPKRDMSNTNISSPNIPYSWRKMCRQQHCSTESGVKQLKESQSKSDEKNLDSENLKKEENACEKHEKLTEIVVVKETKENTFEFLNDNQAGTSSETARAKESTSKIPQHKGDSKEDIASESDQDFCITKQESSFKKDKTMTSSFKNQSNGCLNEQNSSMNEHNEIVENEKSSWKNIVGAEGSMENVLETKTPNQIMSSEMENRSGYNRNDISSKVEPGLNSACGDFVSSVGNQNNAEELTAQASGRDAEESARSVEDNDQDEGIGGISNEYFEEIIGRVIEQQKEAANDECLNFSSFSESDSSNPESSDYSEPDDFHLVCEH